MQNFCSEFKDKKITVMGLGLLGRGVGDAKFLAECGARLTITDLKTEEELADSLKELKDFKDINYVLGEHRLEDFRKCDMVLKAAGVPFDSPYIEEARKYNVPIKMSGALFAKLSGIPVIGITGSRGKSTVTHMIYHTLTKGVSDGEVILGGNVRGISNLQLLKDVQQDSLVVMELDSWQLQGFGEEQISPQIAVFSSFMEDHLNYYHGDMERYFEDKAQIFLHQNDVGTLITTAEVFALIDAYTKKKNITLQQEVKLADSSTVPAGWRMPMPGEHNKVNAALAIEALRATSLPDELIREGIESFPGIPGRLEFLKEVNGVRIYNDNNATTIQATKAGVEALTDEGDVILIMGGEDKGIEIEECAQYIAATTKAIELIPGSGTDRIKKYFPDAETHTSIEAALSVATKRAEEGDCILFSPGFASFNMFANEYERGDQFASLVRALG